MCYNKSGIYQLLGVTSYAGKRIKGKNVNITVLIGCESGLVRAVFCRKNIEKVEKWKLRKMTE